MLSTPWPEKSSESPPGPRVAGIDPGTVSIDLCGLERGEVLLDLSFRSRDIALDPAPLLLDLTFVSRDIALDPAPLVDALVAHGPFALVLGPAGYGLPLVPGERV